MQSEFDLINRIRNRVVNHSGADLALGIGDDTAILREQSGRETLITVDLLVEEIDFKLEYAPPRWLGHKVLAVSLSDIAAMGGAPRYSLLTLGIPKLRLQSEDFWEEFFTGYFALAAQEGVTLIGGDISSAPDRLTIDSFVIGHCPAGRAVRRGGARVGDGIYLTGTIGAAATGLKLLLQGLRVHEGEKSLSQSAIRAHLRPEARVGFGKLVGELNLAHAMIDVSDGLGQDLAHICEESDTAAIIDLELLPVAEEVKLVVENQEEAFSLAICGGEDFELLLIAGMDLEDRLMAVAENCGLALTRIGEITKTDKNLNPVIFHHHGNVKPILAGGYDHFSI